MIRPNILMTRTGETVPLELVEMPGDFKDGYHHWWSDTLLQQSDGLRCENMTVGTVVHFGNGFLVCPHPADGAAAVFRSVPVG